MNEITIAETGLGALKMLMEAAGGVGKAYQSRTKGSPAQRVGRFIYWEIAYNSLMVDLSRSLMPPRVIATRHEWDQPGRAEALAQLLSADETARVAAPYLELDSYDRLLTNSIGNIGVRFRGEDREIISRLAGLFRDSELVLRRHLFSAEQQERLGAAMEENRPKEPRPLTFLDRCTNAAFCVPVWVVFIPNLWLLYDRVMKALEQKRS
jgi:hypothetical protein